MKIKLIYLALALTATAAPGLVQGDDTKPERSRREELREKFQNLSPEEREKKAKEFREQHPEASAAMEKRREEMLKELGLNPEELKKLPESERREKLKEAADRKLLELQKKRADGTITDAETQSLERMERRKKFMEEHSKRAERNESALPSNK